MKEPVKEPTYYEKVIFNYCLDNGKENTLDGFNLSVDDLEKILEKTYSYMDYYYNCTEISGRWYV
jgi:hypothetical protein